MSSDQTSITSAMRILLPLVPPGEKRRFISLLGLSLSISLFELGLTGLVALLAAIFASPEAVLRNDSVRRSLEMLSINLAGEPRVLALFVLCGIFLSIVGKNMLNILHQRQTVIFSETMGAAARAHVLRFFQRAPFLWITHAGVADLGFGLSAAGMLAGTLGIVLQMFTSILMLAALLIGLIGASPIPSLMFLLILGLGGILIVGAVRNSLDRCSAMVYNAEYRLNKISHLALHGIKEMRLYRRENFLFGAYRRQLTDVARARARQQTLNRLPVASLETLGFGTLIVVMLHLIFVQDAGMARISGIMGFMAAAAWRGLPVANRLVDAVTAMRSGLPYLRKTLELITLERTLADELLPLDSDPECLSFDRGIVLENVSFRYPKTETEALNSISITIEAGKMIGLVGLSGAGKSTLANLLAGLMPPESGRLLVDGVPITRDNARAWLRRIGYVPQAPYILDASLAENVALSRWGEDIDRERVLMCCGMASLDFIDDLERGMDTMLGDRGVRLSGGQAQRVAIARALYNEPNLLIFDEATSSLDSRNEKAIHETILSLRNRVTMVVIAHRLDTVEACDGIVWLEEGRVRGAGCTAETLPEYLEALKKPAKPAGVAGGSIAEQETSPRQ